MVSGGLKRDVANRESRYLQVDRYGPEDPFLLQTLVKLDQPPKDVNVRKLESVCMTKKGLSVRWMFLKE